MLTFWNKSAHTRADTNICTDTRTLDRALHARQEARSCCITDGEARAWNDAVLLPSRHPPSPWPSVLCGTPRAARRRRGAAGGRGAPSPHPCWGEHRGGGSRSRWQASPQTELRTPSQRWTTPPVGRAWIRAPPTEEEEDEECRKVAERNGKIKEMWRKTKTQLRKNLVKITTFICSAFKWNSTWIDLLPFLVCSKAMYGVLIFSLWDFFIYLTFLSCFLLSLNSFTSCSVKQF